MQDKNVFFTDRPILEDENASLEEKLKAKIKFINCLRSMGEEPYEIESDVRTAADMCEELYRSWLIKNGHGKNVKFYLYIVLPYISYIYLNANNRREINLYPISKKRKNDFINVFAEEILKIQNSPGAKGFLTEVLGVFADFLESLNNQFNQ